MIARPAKGIAYHKSGAINRYAATRNCRCAGPHQHQTVLYRINEDEASLFQTICMQLFKLDRAAIRAYAPRFWDIVESSSGIGWGYHDDLASMYHENLGQYDEDAEDCART